MGKRAIYILAVVALLGTAGRSAAAKNNYSRPQQVFDAMRTAFVPEAAKGVHARYQWHLKPPFPGDWFVEVNDGQFRIGRGTIPNPDVVFICTGRDWVALSNGTLGGFWANMSGRLKVHGSHQLARKLDQMFP